MYAEGTCLLKKANTISTGTKIQNILLLFLIAIIREYTANIDKKVEW